jgi:hypothetical protein
MKYLVTESFLSSDSFIAGKLKQPSQSHWLSLALDYTLLRLKHFAKKLINAGVVGYIMIVEMP